MIEHLVSSRILLLLSSKADIMKDPSRRGVIQHV